MIVAKEPYQKKPDKIIILQPEWKIQWIYDPKTSKTNYKRVIGFKLITNTELKLEYFGDNLIMQTLKEYFSKQIFQQGFLDEFEIIKRIGKGKYAKVYKVRRKCDGQSFAVKYLHKNKLATIEDANDALFNELQILRSLDNKYCIKTKGTYEDDNGYYILVELYDFDKVFQDELIALKTYINGYEIQKLVMKQLLEGIQYVHKMGIMHRDLKPQNLMFASKPEDGESHQVKIIDFGLAQYTKASRYIYVHVGTPGFVAPEILNNESEKHRYNEKCDLFSIGVILHIMLTGKQLFPGKKFSQVLDSNKKCQTDFTHQRYQDLSEEAMDLMKQLLEVDPQKRLSSEEALKHVYFTSKGTFIKKQSPKEIQDETPTPINYQGPDLKGEYNLNQKDNKKRDIDEFKINFDELNFKMINMMSLDEIAKNKRKDKIIQAQMLMLELVDIFIVLEENQDDDFSFFATPLKVRKFKNLQQPGVQVQVVQTEENKQQCMDQQYLETLEQQEEYKEKGNNEEGSQKNQLTVEIPPKNNYQQNEKQQLPKKLMQLLNLFPVEIFDDELQGNLKKENKKIVYLLAKFIIIGENANENDYSNQVMQEKMNKIKYSGNFEGWFIELLFEMINPVKDLIPDFLYVKTQLEKNLNIQKDQ